MNFSTSEVAALRLASVIHSARDPSARTGCDVRRVGRSARVRLWGALPFTWSANLALHCHGARISILEADAMHMGRARWAATLLVEGVGLEQGVSSCGVDFLAMARHRPLLVPRSDNLASGSFRLEPPAEDGAARLFISVPDRLGLLAGLLARFLACGLRPREICARTRGGRAEDWFALERQGGTPPATEDMAALAAGLRSAQLVPCAFD